MLRGWVTVPTMPRISDIRIHLMLIYSVLSVLRMHLMAAPGPGRNTLIDNKIIHNVSYVKASMTTTTRINLLAISR
ncbi:hypothetical protein TWF106_009528 [Orbilia oligospora]|uniref:Uncharacterized protein n=1 Tax=Orbilia oligospora TaxID=2813651 RepID=A0A7C8QHI7_ORBOL|nr:hypothetical protein TWF106_009528 [Orbilia oligospora]